MKFMIEPETQAQWHMATGYYAISQQAYELDSVKAFMRKIRCLRWPWSRL